MSDDQRSTHSWVIPYVGLEAWPRNTIDAMRTDDALRDRGIDPTQPWSVYDDKLNHRWMVKGVTLYAC